ncbi:MAG: hypothetical protein AAFZ07_04700 [Actinomycetota bacterium]
MGSEPDTCFVITPIGQPGEDRNRRAERLCEWILRPELEAAGLALVRGDEIAEPGNVPVHIVQAIVEARVVVADLIDENGNVYYELGVAEAFHKPLVRFGDPSAGPIPFDNSWNG